MNLQDALDNETACTNSPLLSMLRSRLMSPEDKHRIINDRSDNISSYMTDKEIELIRELIRINERLKHITERYSLELDDYSDNDSEFE